MNPNTGRIGKFESEDAARRAGFTVPLTAEQADELLRLEEFERLARAAIVLAFSPARDLPKPLPIPGLTTSRGLARSQRNGEYHARLMDRQRAEIERIEALRTT